MGRDGTADAVSRFERVRALHGDCNRTDFLYVNPRAEVPALVDGAFFATPIGTTRSPI